MKFTLLNLPIEPLEERYTKQWDVWFREAFDRNGIDHSTVYGRHSVHTLPPGNFLDPLGTFIWKFSQLEGVVSRLAMMKDQTVVVFLHDGWFPGIECFPYIEKLAKHNNLKIKICGFWHAGSYDPTDLLGLEGLHNRLQWSEKCWFSLCDLIFVGSLYHKEKLHCSLDGPSPTDQSWEKIKVVGCPVQKLEFVPLEEKQNIVVWPHRIATDKRPEVFDALSKNFEGQAQFIKTKEQKLSKSSYYDLLKQAKVAVSTATHENFGIAMVEACFAGCYCLVPNDLSYREIFPKEWRYDSFQELQDKLNLALQWNLRPFPECVDVLRFRQERVTDTICHEIKQLMQDTSTC